jgi:glutamine synthetase
MSYHENILKYQPSRKILLESLYKQLGLNILFGAEIEFYVPNLSSIYLITQDIGSLCTLTKEQGKNQYEVHFVATPDPIKLCENIENVKQLLIDKYSANFHPKPFNQDYGNALHIHCSFYDHTGLNLMHKSGDNENDFTLNVIGGLCASMLESMLIFAPYADSYLRFQSTTHDNPTHVSWGGNNRTTAIRIPPSNSLIAEDHNRRIEHRVAGSDADPFLVLFAILAGIHYGLNNKIKAPARIYGIASDIQYNLTPLPNTLNEAIELFNSGLILNYLLDKIIENL